MSRRTTELNPCWGAHEAAHTVRKNILHKYSTLITTRGFWFVHIMNDSMVEIIARPLSRLSLWTSRRVFHEAPVVHSVSPCCWAPFCSVPDFQFNHHHRQISTLIFFFLIRPVERPKRTSDTNRFLISATRARIWLISRGCFLCPSSCKVKSDQSLTAADVGSARGGVCWAVCPHSDRRGRDYLTPGILSIQVFI